MKMKMYTRIYQPSFLDLFRLLLFRFGLFIIKNKAIILISLLVFSFLAFSLEYLYNFLLYKGIIYEDCFTLNITGESSSQGSTQSNINSGGSSSNNPKPNSQLPFWDTVMIKDAETDTDILANYLTKHKGERLSEVGINFRDHSEAYWQTSNKDRYLSTVARFVRVDHSTLFVKDSPGITPINDTLINGIRAIHKDIPVHYRF
jgi:hypothetical protein